jgi:hypothetical protein
MHVFWQILRAVFRKWTFLFFEKCLKSKPAVESRMTFFVKFKRLKYAVYLYASICIFIMILCLGFLWVFWGFFHFQFFMQSFYIINIHKNITIMVIKLIFLLQCMFFLGFFISKSFHLFPFYPFESSFHFFL